MSSFTIFHAPRDHKAAETLGAELTARGHRVAFDGDPDAPDVKRFANLKLCDCIIVIWTPGSVGSEGICAVAREAHRLGLLLPVRVDSLRTDQLPPEFRKLNTLVIDDVDGIVSAAARIILISLRSRGVSDRIGSRPHVPEVAAAAEPRRLSHEKGYGGDLGNLRMPGVGGGRAYRGDRIGAAPRSRPGPRGGTGAASSPRTGRMGAAPQASPQESALAIEAGRLVHKIPNKMWLGEPEMVEVRLGREATADLASGLLGRGALTSEDLPIVETMSASLHSDSGAFEIHSQTEAVQLIMRDHLKGTPFEQAAYGRWLWLVTSRKTGAHQLYVRVSAALKDSRGISTSITLPDREFEVSVAVHAGRATVQVLRRGIPAVGGVIGAGLLGAITQDLWWPKLKALLQSSGWIG